MDHTVAAEKTSSKTARSPEELFPLIDFCRAGKLKEVSEWIAAGHPIDPPLNAKRTRRASPLQIAIEKGFYSLTELLLDDGCDPLAQGNALYDAVSRDQVDIARLLLERGMPAQSVDMASVFDASRAMIALFIDKGADPSADLSYYEALCVKVHPLLFVLKDYKDRFADLQRQADMALCYHCEKGSARNVGLLVWGGARPDAEVPDPNYSDDCTSCAIYAAAQNGRLDIIKQLKPQNYPKVLATIFAHVWSSGTRPVIEYLVGIGAPLNSKPNGSSDLLEHLIWRLGWGTRGVLGYSSPTETTELVAIVEYVCRLGAKWVPDPADTTRHVRDRFRKIEPQHLKELFRVFRDTGAVSVELLDSILASPALRKSLGSYLRPIENILHPQPPSAKTPATTSPCRVSKPEPEPLTIQELRVRAKPLLLDVVRQQPNLHFTATSVSSTFDGKSLRKRLEMSKDDERDPQAVVTHAEGQLNRQLRSFQLQSEWWGRSNCRLIANLTGSAEWPEAIHEAWSFAESANEHYLTDPGLKLRDLIRDGEIGPDWTQESSITWKIGLRGRERCLAAYLHEVAGKAAIQIEWEQRGERWADPQEYRIHIGNEPAGTRIKALNPSMKIEFDDIRRKDQDTVRELLYRQLLNALPTDKTPFSLISISTRQELNKCFPQSRSISGEKLAEFFHELPLNKTLLRSFDFREQAKSWFFAVDPKVDWTTALAAVREEMSKPSLVDQYGLSGAAAKLLLWIQGIPKTKFAGSWTPIVEDACDKWIGIECPWSEENFPAYLQMLLDEINERTDYDLRLQPWHEHNDVKSRIRVAHKKSDLDEVVKQIQWLALKRGRLIDAEAAREKLNDFFTRCDSPAG